ncbi:MAG: hypothetical protein FWG68_06015 [Defluviitaleaceae bacterium]|nr:hypothetical protein [Defluviitaleaceae bacterium]
MDCLHNVGATVLGRPFSRSDPPNGIVMFQKFIVFHVNKCYNDNKNLNLKRSGHFNMPTTVIISLASVSVAVLIWGVSKMRVILLTREQRRLLSEQLKNRLMQEKTGG